MNRCTHIILPSQLENITLREKIHESFHFRDLLQQQNLSVGAMANYLLRSSPSNNDCTSSKSELNQIEVMLKNLNENIKYLINEYNNNDTYGYNIEENDNNNNDNNNNSNN